MTLTESRNHLVLPTAIRTGYLNIQFPQPSCWGVQYRIPAVAISAFVALTLTPMMRYALQTINRKERKPFIFYLHPWEIDPEQPRMQQAKPLSRFRHYNNLSKTAVRLRRLFSDFSFTPFPAHAE